MKIFILASAFLFLSVQFLYAQSIIINISSPLEGEIVFTPEVSVNVRVSFRGLSTDIRKGLNPVEAKVFVYSVAAGGSVEPVHVCSVRKFADTVSCPPFSFKTQSFTPGNYLIKVEAKIFDTPGNTLATSEQIKSFIVKNIKDAPIVISPVEEFFFDDGSSKIPSFKISLVKGLFYAIEITLDKKLFNDASCDFYRTRLANPGVADGYFFNSFWGGTAQGQTVVEPVQAPASSPDFNYPIPEVVWHNFRKGGLSKGVRQIYYRLLVSTDPQFKNATSTLEGSALLKAPFITLRSGPNRNVAPRCELTGFNIGALMGGRPTFPAWPWEITIQDKDSGLQNLILQDSENAEVVSETLEPGEFSQLGGSKPLNFGGTKSPIVVRATKTLPKGAKIDRGEPIEVDLGLDDGIGGTACDIRTRIINESLELHYSYRYNSSDTRGGRFPAGVFTISAIWYNNADPRLTITEVQFKVTAISRHATLIDADEGEGYQGSTIFVDNPGVLACRIDYKFEIGLTARSPFEFFINVFGTVVGPFAESDVR